MGYRREGIRFIPIRVERQERPFDLVELILRCVKEAGEVLLDGDILIISSKFAALSEGRFIKIDDVKAGEEARELARELSLPEGLAQLLLEEADGIYSGLEGFALAFKEGVLMPNAGIDRSNIFAGYAILYPQDPSAKAEEVMKRLREATGREVGVALCDSRLMPTRLGTISVAVAVAGFEPIHDERGRRDLFNNVLKVTQRAMADDLCSAAHILMGEADEGIPIVIARFEGDAPPWRMTSRRIDSREMVIEPERCIYIRGIERAGEWSRWHRINAKAVSEEEAKAE